MKTKQEAEDSALAANANNDAKVAISGSGLWLAISTTNEGGWGAASGETLYKAVDSAEEYCKKYNGMEGTIQGSVFGGDNGVDFKIELDAEFPEEERSILVRAIQRMRWAIYAYKGRHDEIATRYSYLSSIRERSFIHDYEPTEERMGWLMGCQAFYLAFYQHSSLKVVPYYEQSNYWAKAPVGRVIVPYGTRGIQDMSGSFEVKVNRYWLGASGIGSDISAWAGVMAHELMHNLGHLHGEDEYGDHLQINALQQLVRTSGEYKRNDPCPAFACDCRKLWR